MGKEIISPKSDIGECVIVLKGKEWGRTPFKGKLKSQAWWQRRYEELVAPGPDVILPILEPAPPQEVPPRYEDEMGI